MIIFGAKDIGIHFLKSECFKRQNIGNVFFYDNDFSLPFEICGVKRIEKIEILENPLIVIASRRWKEIYAECINKKLSKIKIYYEDNDELYTYKERCYVEKGDYENDHAVVYLSEKKKQVLSGVKEFQSRGDLFHNITEVSIALSNLCNYAVIHPKCPASRIKGKEIFPASLYYRIIDELAEKDFKGTICFHMYNEPMMDPRLFMFIKYIKDRIPAAIPKVYSNGYYLNQMMVDELIGVGVGFLQVTAYGDMEYDRLLGLHVRIPYEVIYGRLDDRIDGYDRRKDRGKMINAVCHNFFTQVAIAPNGDLAACCLDYMHNFGLGNVYSHTLEECLSDKNVIDFQKKLLCGDRSTFPICINCSWNHR